MITDPKLQAAYEAHRAGNFVEAAGLYRDVLSAAPTNFDALYLLGFLHLQRGEFVDAEHLIGAALQINPASLDAIYNYGWALQKLGRNEAALNAFDRLLALGPAIKEAWALRGRVLLSLRRHREALASFDRAIAAGLTTSETWNNRASALLALGGIEEALRSYDEALRLETRADLISNRGNALSELGRFDEAARDFDGALQLDSNTPYARGSRLFCKLRCCDWDTLHTDRQIISEELAQDRRVIQPGELIAVSSSPVDQLKCARLWVSNEIPAPPAALWHHTPYRHERIRLAYVSADFRSHAILQLMAGVFEEHHKGHFEITAVSLGTDDGTPLRKRAVAAFEHFLEIGDKTDAEIAGLIKDREVDIAVDLMGFTSGSRTAIFAMRPAPLQVNYLGFPGTMGADFIDYIIADRTVAPIEQQSFYSEKVVHLPDTFQANDLRRPIAERAFSRSDLGLPERAFVFCSFNSHFKFTPQVFDVWMGLLKQVDGSVLWLLQNTDAGAHNLRREAETRGVAADRLIFAPRMRIDDHVARHRCADLFLDTLPCNSGTTASDALWAGLPVLTCIGATFAGRVAASLLHAGGLHELVTQSLEDYAAKAVQLAKDPGMLTRLKHKLATGRTSNPLFDTKRFTRHLEAAFTTMWLRHKNGETPAHFAVRPEEAAD